MRLGVPSTSALTRWMLGFHLRFVRRWEWLSDIPIDGCLPHMSHTDRMFQMAPLSVTINYGYYGMGGHNAHHQCSITGYHAFG